MKMCFVKLKVLKPARFILWDCTCTFGSLIELMYIFHKFQISKGLYIKTMNEQWTLRSN